MGEAARGCTNTHPPFEAGNEAAVTHGARSERLVAKRAAELHPALVEAAPWLDRPEFTGAVARYERAEVRARLLHAHLSKTALADGIASVPDSLWKNLHAAERLAAQLAGRLGLDPASRAQLAKDSAIAGHFAADAQAALLAEGRRIVETRAAALIEAEAEEEALDGDE